MAPATATAPMKAEEFFDWANRSESFDVLQELDEGEVCEIASPGEAHALVCWFVAQLLSAYLRIRGSGRLLTNDGGQLLARRPDTVRGPDIALYLSDLTLEEAVPGHSTRRADLIVEIGSPSERDSRLIRRIDQYLKNGIAQVWVVDPEDRAVTVYRTGAFPELLELGSTLDARDLLPEFQCPVEDFFVMPKLQKSFRESGASMSTATAIAPMTAEEFFDWANRPERGRTLYELDAGTIVAMPSPGELHGTICGIIAFLLNLNVRERKAGQVIANDAGLVVQREPDTVRGPDVQLFLQKWKKSTLNLGHVTRTPDLIVEVLTPSDAIGKTRKRVEQYLALGVPLVWVVDPDDSAVYQYLPGKPRTRFDANDELTGSGVLPDFHCKVADLFRMPGDDDTESFHNP